MPELTYLNFDLEIEKADGGYRAHVLSSPAGEARTPLGPVDSLPGDAAPQVLGGMLFDALFRDDVLSCLRRSLDMAQRSGRGLRIRLRLAETPELAGLPWELLYDRQSASFLALSRETPLVRYLDLPEPAESINPEIRLRVLAVIASPSDYPALDVEREWTNLKQGLADLETRGIVTLDRLDPPTVEALQQQLLKHEYHILHFLGHGDYSPEAKDSVLLLTRPDGQGEAITGETFSALVRDQRSLRLAVLNACRGAVSGENDPYSGVAQRLVRGGVPAVIAMRSSISDAAAIALARSFYTALATGAAVDEAMAEARKTLYSGGFPNEWATAVLYMRAADGHLWRPDPAIKKKRIRLALAAAGAVVALVLLAVLAWSFVGPAQMVRDQATNIAVLDPGEQQANGSTTSSTDGEMIRRWLVAGLTANAPPSPTPQPIRVWHNDLKKTEKRSPLPVLTAAPGPAREDEADLDANKVAADVVVSGVISGTTSRRELVLEFYIGGPRLSQEATNTIGRYTLGAPIPLPDSGKWDSVSRDTVSRDVMERMKTLSALLLALQQDLGGRHDLALDQLASLQADLEKQPAATRAGAGMDVVYYLLAREKLFLRRYAEAAADAEKATTLNEHNVRAYIVWGGALLQQGLRPNPEVTLSSNDLMDDAEKKYQKAVAEAEAASGVAPQDDAAPNSALAAIARLGLGDALATRGERLFNQWLSDPSPDKAPAIDARFKTAIDELPALVVLTLQDKQQWRMAGQYYAATGSAWHYRGTLAARQGDAEHAREYLKDARASFGLCKQQLDHAREDKTLQFIVQSRCGVLDKAAEQELAQLGGG
jgi:tetratricopeptide (TPR) repeat protein